MAEQKRGDPRPVRAAASPWNMGELSVRQLFERVTERLRSHQTLDRAAGLSYYFAFALFPTLLFLTALFGMLPFPDVLSQLLGYADRVLPGDAASLLRKTLTEVVSGASGSLLSVGALTALWAASSGMRSIMIALNAAYRVTDGRRWWHARLVAIGLTVGFSLFVLTGLLLLVFGGHIGAVVADRIGLGPVFTVVWTLLRWPTAVLLVLTGMALVYWLAPAAGRRWHWITPGSSFAVLAWILMSSGLRLYVAHFGNYNATYGSIGGVILLMLWLYLSGVALLIGAEINSTVEDAVAGDG